MIDLFRLYLFLALILDHTLQQSGFGPKNRHYTHKVLVGVVAITE